MTLFSDFGAVSAKPYASPSRLKVFRGCPKRYAFQYVEKLPTRPSPHFDLGSNVHTALAHWLRLPPAERTVDGLLELYRAAWRVNRPAFVRRSREELRTFGERGIAMLRSFAADLEPGLEPVAIELGVRLDLEDVVIGGRVDRIDALPDGTLRVVDYKTGKFPADGAKARAEDLAASVYARGASLAFAGMPVSRVEYLHLATMERLTFDLAEDAVARAIEGVASLAREVHAAETSGAFTARPVPSVCRWCDFLRLCGEGQAAVDGARARR